MTTEPTPTSASGGAPEHHSDRFEVFEEFMATVRKACATPEGRAVLRDALADDIASPWRMYMHLLPAGRIPSYRADQEAERPFLLIAAMYAATDAPNPRTAKHRPRPRLVDGRKNLGWSFARAVELQAIPRKTAASHLSALAEQEAEGLRTDLPGTVSLLRSRQVPVQWPVLLRDLTRWPRWADDVRIEWVRSFHAPTTWTEAANGGAGPPAGGDDPDTNSPSEGQPA